MTYDPGALDVCHQSHGSCLAKILFEHDTPQPSGAAAVKGAICHEIIERFTQVSAEHSDVKPMSVVREVLAARIDDPETTDDVVGDVVEIMAAAFGPRSELRFGLRDGYLTKPEWRWALDDDFRPIAPCANCGGTKWIDVAGDAPYRALCAMYGKTPCFDGWSAAPAFVGTVDRLEYGPEIHIHDWKTVLARESSVAQANDRQGRWYSLAAILHFDGATEIVWHKVFLRFQYAATHRFKREDPWFEATKARMRAARAKRLAAVASGVWPETLGVDCAYCPRLFACGEQKRVRTSGSRPDATMTEQANDWLGVRAWMAAQERLLKAHVEASGQPIPLENDDQEVLGKEPVERWLAAKRYESTMNELEALDMTPAQREEWFRYCAKHHFPARVKKALETLVGRSTARRLIDAGGWLDPIAVETFSVWSGPDMVSEPRDTMTLEELDERIDELFSGG